MLGQVVRQGGATALYRGLDSKLLQSVSAAGFMFCAYENIHSAVRHLLAGSKPD